MLFSCTHSTCNPQNAAPASVDQRADSEQEQSHNNKAPFGIVNSAAYVTLGGSASRTSMMARIPSITLTMPLIVKNARFTLL